jgi:hypothetical protein
MYKIALIQNQSEMAHYGYADARPIIHDLDYDPTLFTAANIDELGKLLDRGHFDAVIFGSNALNDKTIRSEVFSDNFRTTFHAWLSRGRGCLCLHQLRLAGLEDSNLKFLPDPYNLAAVVRPLTEKSADGELSFGARSAGHILFLYPHDISSQEIQQTSLQFKSLSGLYWHSWKNPNLSHWEILIEDKSYEPPRPLVLSLREPNDFRIVVSALTLDWQKQKIFLRNILSYVVEGRHNTAMLIDEGKKNTAFEYLIGILRSRKLPFRKYSLIHNYQELEKNLINGVHTTLLLGPFVDFSKFSESILSVIREKISSGYLKIITLEEHEHQMSSFSISGGERDALQLLQTTELYIQDELRIEGTIDGSFWSTVEALQVLESLKLSKGNYKILIDKTLEFASKHDRYGSYDEVFGVSCALLWIRGKYLGADARETKMTAQWIRERINDYDSREQALAYFTLAEIGLLTEPEKNTLIKLLNGLEREQLSEIDVVMYLRAALAIKHSKRIEDFVSVLKSKIQSSGAWVDLATTATAVSTLVDLLQWNPQYSGTSVTAIVENMVFKAIIFIQKSLQPQNLPIDMKYPWEGKASTTIKCTSAWLKFDELVDFPVYELAGAMEKYDLQSTFLQSGKQALSVLESLKQDNVALSKKIEENLANIISLKRQSRRIPYIALALFFLYLLITVIIDVTYLQKKMDFPGLLKTAFIDQWAFHFGVVGIIVAIIGTTAAVLSIPWIQWKKKYWGDKNID